MRRIYLASSWRNPRQPAILAALREAGHQVYDFRNPAPGEHGFAWSQIDPSWESWTVAQYIAGLQHPIAKHGHSRDQGAMEWADTCVLLLPCGRSAHIEAGWCQGSGRPTLVLSLAPCEPELMYLSLHSVHGSLDSLLSGLASLPPGPALGIRRGPALPRALRGCPTCGGFGVLGGRVCETCAGSGKVGAP